MNKEKLTWGLILLFVGLILLLTNLDVITFYWQSVFRFWPVFLIIVGVNLLVPRRGIGNIVSIVVTILALAFLAWQGMRPPQDSWWDFQIERVRGLQDQNQDKQSKQTNAHYSRPFDDKIKRARLSISEGAVDYHVGGHTAELYEADVKGTFGSHTFETKITDSLANLTFSLADGKKKNWKMGVDENKVLIKLNDRPVWDVNLEMGAGSAEFDLSNLKIASFRLEGGALAFETKFGMPLKETRINVELGAASVKIAIPKAAACRIVVDSGLSSKDFRGFKQQGEDAYVTEGYETAGNKFLINLEGGLSSFNVTRY